ncbi:hypothetical protein ACFL6S_12870 [Candidatus Poribacteria bacterium]
MRRSSWFCSKTTIAAEMNRLVLHSTKERVWDSHHWGNQIGGSIE